MLEYMPRAVPARSSQRRRFRGVIGVFLSIFCGVSFLLCLIVAGLWIGAAATGGWQGTLTGRESSAPPSPWFEITADPHQVQVMRLQPLQLDWWASSKGVILGDWDATTVQTEQWLGVKVTRGMYCPNAPMPFASYTSSTIPLSSGGLTIGSTGSTTIVGGGKGSGSGTLTLTGSSLISISSNGSQAVAVAVPWLVAVGGLALPPAGWLGLWIVRLVRVRRRSRRVADGHCIECGYDLRAGPEAGALLERCPECGTDRRLVVLGDVA
jgi:hypothetical protein